jgi:hypothetical protein
MSALCAVGFVGWQAIADVRMYNLFFTIAWVMLEAVVLLWGYRLWGKGLGEHKVISWEIRQAILSNL